MFGLGLFPSLAKSDEPTGESHYYVLGVEKDHQKSFSAFQKENNHLYLISIRLNGDGVPVDVEATQTIFDTAVFQIGCSRLTRFGK